MTARIDALEKSLAGIARRPRQSCARSRTSSRPPSMRRNRRRAIPAVDSAPAVDLSAHQRSASTQIERARRAQAAASKPADDMPLRRVVAAALLDVAVRHGDPFAGALAGREGARARCRTSSKPLDPFAEKGVPNPPALNRELLTLVPKLSPAADNPTTGSGIVDRLQAGASKLVRIERTDAAGNDRSAVVARVDRGGAAQRFRRGAARTGFARCRRPRARAGLARQGGRARCRARRVPSIRRRGDGVAREIGAIGFS